MLRGLESGVLVEGENGKMHLLGRGIRPISTPWYSIRTWEDEGYDGVQNQGHRSELRGSGLEIVDQEMVKGSVWPDG
jgi:hypothetical protein